MFQEETEFGLYKDANEYDKYALQLLVMPMFPY